MKVVLVYNPHSGSSIGLRELKRHFAQADIEILDAVDVTKNLSKSLQPYLHKETVIAAYGGDGTLNSIANVVAGTKATLAPLAGGTLNHFTKDLGVPQDLDEALNALKSAKPRTIDVACINDRIFLNNSSIGLYPSALQTRDEMTRKNLGKWPAAIVADFKAFARYRSYRLTINGETLKTPFVFVGNNDYRLEKRIIGERTRFDEHILSVYAITSVNHYSFFKILVRALFGKLETSDDVKIWKTQSVTIESRHSKLRISRDGEHEKITSPLEYKVLPGALRVIGGR